MDKQHVRVVQRHPDSIPALCRGNVLPQLWHQPPLARNLHCRADRIDCYLTTSHQKSKLGVQMARGDPSEGVCLCSCLTELWEFTEIIPKIIAISYYKSCAFCHKVITTNKRTIINTPTARINSKNPYICFDKLLSSSGGLNKRFSRSEQPATC